MLTFVNDIHWILPDQCNIIICTFLLLCRRAKNLEEQRVHGTFLVNQENLFTHMTFCFLNLWQLFILLVYFFMKKSRKVCSFNFVLKNILNKNNAWNKNKNSKYWLSWQTRKIHVYIRHFIPWISQILLIFLKMCRIACHFIFSKRVSPKWRIQLYCTDPAICLLKT